MDKIVFVVHNFKQKIVSFKNIDFSYKNIKKLVFNKKFIVVFLIFLYTISWLIAFVFVDKKRGDNLKITDLPYQEKVADGVWKLKNRDPIKQVLAQGPKADLNLKEVKSEALNPKSETYKWEVTISSGTKFEFGGVSSDTPEGKVIPSVKIINSQGYFVEYQPKSEARNPKSSIINHFVTPTVKGNVISWEISKGVVARYTMMQDRVKADYIVNDQWLMVNGQKTKWDGRLDFDATSGNEKDSKQALKGELMPGGDIDWFTEISNDSGPIQTHFTFPKPVIKDSSKFARPRLAKSGASDIDGEYDLTKIKDGEYELAIVLDSDQLKSATWPLTIDPVIIDAAATTTSTAYGNARHIIRDAWGNLIVVVSEVNGVNSDAVWYKTYTGITWSDAGIDLDGTADAFNTTNGVAADIDSSQNIHVAFDYTNAAANPNIAYVKLTVARSADNAITGITRGTSINLAPFTASTIRRTSLIIANKDGGAGVEKVAVAYAMNGTNRGEIHFMQCDVADDCTTAANWKNASEEINGSGTCSDTATSGAAGLPNSVTCKGTADKILGVATTTTHHGVLTQIPGKPKRSPASVKKDINGTFTTLSNTIDNSTGTTDDVNSLTTTDYIYVGDDKPFSKAVFDITNTNASISTFGTFQYWNGTAWTSMSNVIDITQTGAAGVNEGSFRQDGSILFDESSNWATTTVDGIASKYWIRIRPAVAFDTTVSIAEVYITDRNSKALMVVGGVDSTDDLGASYVSWDEIQNDRWEKTGTTGSGSSAIGVPWRSGITALDTLGGDWTAFTNFPLSAAVDYKNNAVYVSYVEQIATDVLHVKKIANNLDPTVAGNWTDTVFPTVTEGTDIVLSLTSDGSDIYLFYVLDVAVNSLVFRKCIPSGGGGDINTCDNANDWGSEKTLDNTTDVSHPQAVVTKVTGDTVAIDTIYTMPTALDVVYERYYVDLTDKTVVVAASGDDAFERNCVSGTDDQDITATTVKLGRETADASCVGSVDSENHIGLRFTAIAVIQGAAISSAYVDLRVTTRTGATPVDFTIYGEDADNSAAFTAFTDCADPCSNGVNTRTKTTSSTAQSVDFVTNTYRIDVTDLVQEIVCRGAANSQPCVGNFNGAGTWASGNALTLLLISAEGGASDNNALFVSQDDATTTMLDPTIQINCADSCSTVNVSNTTWASIGAGGNAAGDVNGNWDSRKKLSFDNRASLENLTDFPVLVRLNSTTIDYTKTKSAGEDLRFVDADGSTLLKYEIEKWDEAGESIVWVKVPQINLGVASDYVYMYYNNANGSAGQDITNVWDTNNKGIWHLGEGDATTSNFYQDSTTNNNDGTLVDADGSSNQESAVIGNGMIFSGSPDYINVVNANSLSNTGSGWSSTAPFTLSTWVKFTNITQNTKFMISKDASGANTGDASLFFQNNTQCTPNTPRVSFLNQVPSNKCATGNLVTAESWYHYVFTLNGSDQGMLYENGVLVANTAAYGSFWNNVTDVQLGGAVNGTFSFTGSLDEVRISGGIARSADWAEAEYLSTKRNSSFVSIAAEQTAAGSVVHNYSLGSAVQLATGSASFADFDHPLSSQEYVAVEGDDLSYVPVPATTNYASQSAAPAFMFKVNNPNNTNTDKIDAQAVIKSTLATSSKPVYLQVYRGGATDDWITMATNNNTAAADTDITLTSPTISTNTSDYYFNETPGIGTRYAECTTSTANCWTYWRVYQDNPTTTFNDVLSMDYVNVTFAANGPDKVAFSNAARTLTAAACNGAASVFTMELQSGTTPTNPLATTVVRVTSNSSSYTIYSDDTCSTTVTNGDFTYTTAQNTKSVYIIDNKKSITTRTLTGTRQSGDTLTTGTQNYTVNAGAVSKLVITLPGQTFTDGTGNSGTVTNQLSGIRFPMQINATDANFNVNTSYTGDKVLVFSGPGVGTSTPTVLDKNNVEVNYGSNTTITFSGGTAASIQTTLYKGETTTITATDGGSYGNASSSLTIDAPSTKIRGGTTIRGGTRVQ